ncbi:MAG: hypothetical protein JWP32_1945 [Schumannella sp.]|nr:hypothetical protein [Schumannella sp.]
MTLSVPLKFPLPGKTKNSRSGTARPHSGSNVNPFGGLARRRGMETLAELLATGDTGRLILALVAFVIAGVLAAIAVRLRPRPRRRTAR